MSESRTVWSIGYQDVIAIGKLFTTGKLNTDCVIALAGPQVKNPRLVRTQVGASLAELTKGELKDGENRIISGSVFGGRNAAGDLAFLGRYHTQVSVLEEGYVRCCKYLRPGFDRFPRCRSRYQLMKKMFDFTTTTNGSERAMVPIGTYERIMLLDVLPTQRCARSLRTWKVPLLWGHWSWMKRTSHCAVSSAQVSTNTVQFCVRTSPELKRRVNMGLRSMLDSLEPHFLKGALEKMYPLYEAIDTGLYSPPSVTNNTARA